MATDERIGGRVDAVHAVDRTGLRRGRPCFEAALPIAALRAAAFPKVVVSGGHHPGFEAMCTALAADIGAAHRVVAGAGHEIQFTGAPLNELLAELWRQSCDRP